MNHQLAIFENVKPEILKDKVSYNDEINTHEKGYKSNQAPAIGILNTGIRNPWSKKYQVDGSTNLREVIEDFYSIP